MSVRVGRAGISSPHSIREIDWSTLAASVKEMPMKLVLVNP